MALKSIRMRRYWCMGDCMDIRGAKEIGQAVSILPPPPQEPTSYSGSFSNGFHSRGAKRPQVARYVRWLWKGEFAVPVSYDCYQQEVPVSLKGQSKVSPTGGEMPVHNQHLTKEWCRSGEGLGWVNAVAEDSVHLRQVPWHSALRATRTVEDLETAGWWYYEAIRQHQGHISFLRRHPGDERTASCSNDLEGACRRGKEPPLRKIGLCTWAAYALHDGDASQSRIYAQESYEKRRWWLTLKALNSLHLPRPLRDPSIARSRVTCVLAVLLVTNTRRHNCDENEGRHGKESEIWFAGRMDELYFAYLAPPSHFTYMDTHKCFLRVQATVAVSELIPDSSATAQPSFYALDFDGHRRASIEQSVLSIVVLLVTKMPQRKARRKDRVVKNCLEDIVIGIENLMYAISDPQCVSFGCYRHWGSRVQTVYPCTAIHENAPKEICREKTATSGPETRLDNKEARYGNDEKWTLV
ncbi:hypothetical protein IW261DRAFT_1424607 [Armillaria novae-zelandiae]|uniref:Uncharacterized protein n=1 Tax=Armillaria novae-zelandiae TaxID=153914 RepID=A0AA39NUA4_9AGAR|nr:hypothetical protein IW261DRAFT_1424607 [Armillaria novae-zelandiae]